MTAFLEYIYREIGWEKVKITSFGKAVEERIFKDSFGRKWPVRTWNISKKSAIKIFTGYFKENDMVIWDVKGLIFGEDINSNTSVGIFRKEKPAPELNDSFQREWNNIKKFILVLKLGPWLIYFPMKEREI